MYKRQNTKNSLIGHTDLERENNMADKKFELTPEIKAKLEEAKKKVS